MSSIGYNEPKDHNPIHQKSNGKWAFWDEVWANEIGDYNSQKECAIALLDYCEKELGIAYEGLGDTSWGELG